MSTYDLADIEAKAGPGAAREFEAAADSKKPRLVEWLNNLPGMSDDELYGVEGDRDSEVLPRAVQEWAGLDDRVPSVVTSLHDDDPDDDPEAVSIEVAELNDCFGYSFEALAELIEAQL